MNIERRTILGMMAGAGIMTLSGLGLPALHAARAATNQRFVFIIQRGAADGLAIAEPRGDKNFAALRSVLLSADPLRLDGYFALHPALPNLHNMLQAREAQLVHAVGTVYRQRSHFDAQNIMESGGAKPHELRSGWMNRLIGLLPSSEKSAIALSSSVPLALSGPQMAGSYPVGRSSEASDDLLMQADMLYAHDKQLAPLWNQAMETKMLADGSVSKGGSSAAATGRIAAELLTPQNGARLMMIETSGWDTHSAQQSRLKLQLSKLDEMLASLKAGLGPIWDNTLVLIATEFGRTVAVNGTRGSDHGTGSLAIWAGGGVNAKAPVRGQWPGLATHQLYQGRDLMPSQSFERMTAEKLAGHFNLPLSQTLATLFPAI